MEILAISFGNPTKFQCFTNEMLVVVSRS
jgi:hypothetical protein